MYVLGAQETITDDVPRLVFEEKDVDVVNDDDTISTVKYFMRTGEYETKVCDTESVPYMEVIINPISTSTIDATVGLDLDAWYQEPSDPNNPTTGITNRGMLTNMCRSYNQTLVALGYSIYGGTGGVSVFLCFGHIASIPARHSVRHCSGAGGLSAALLNMN